MVRLLYGPKCPMLPLLTDYEPITLRLDSYQEQKSAHLALELSGGEGHLIFMKTEHLDISAAFFSELFTWGAQYIIRNMTSKKLFGASRPTFPCASPKILLEQNYHTIREFLT